MVNNLINTLNEYNLFSPSKGVYLIKAPSQYALTAMFIRAQEFYESPYPQIRRNYFDLHQYMDIYAEHNGNFTYFEDWEGYNIPGKVVKHFFTVFSIKNKLLPREEILKNLLQYPLSLDKKFYVIGTFEDGTVIQHELAHAYYYLYPTYQKQMKILIRELSNKARTEIYQHLKDNGYRKAVIDDEIQAYLATSDMFELAEQFENIELPWTNVLKFKKVFVDFHKEKSDG